MYRALKTEDGKYNYFNFAQVFGDNLSDIMDAKGVTNEQLAIAVDKTEQQIRNIRQGRQMPRTPVLFAMADFLCVSVYQLVGMKQPDKEEPPKPLMKVKRPPGNLVVRKCRAANCWANYDDGQCECMVIDGYPFVCHGEKTRLQFLKDRVKAMEKVLEIQPPLVRNARIEKYYGCMENFQKDLAEWKEQLAKEEGR